MFAEAIEAVARYTRPIHSISRNYGSTVVQPGTATLFFVNSEGWALTTAHVADQLMAGKALAGKAGDFRREMASIKGSPGEAQRRLEIERKYGYAKDTVFELHNRFVNCVEGNLNCRIVKHGRYDVALVKFEGYARLLCDSFPVFPANSAALRPGRMLCRLGFPFPEFTNFTCDEQAGELRWTDAGRTITPLFPIEGMVTRRLLDGEGNIFGFEMSTPGLRGQSGGPAFDADGTVWGVQFGTKHLDLSFDIDQEVLRRGIRKRVTDSAFLHAGACIHVDVVKAFMKQNGVAFADRT